MVIYLFFVYYILRIRYREKKLGLTPQLRKRKENLRVVQALLDMRSQGHNSGQ